MIIFHYITKLIPFEVVVLICVFLILAYLLCNLAMGRRKKGSYDSRNWKFVKDLIAPKILTSSSSTSRFGIDDVDDDCMKRRQGNEKDDVDYVTSKKHHHYYETKSSSSSRGENECRRCIEKLTGRKFPKMRPDFLKNDVTLSNLELDCYCDELKLAVEYNGQQHYAYIPHFHSSKDAFYNVKYRDDMKRRLCESNGIDLIVVPYTVPEDEIEEYITDRLNAIIIRRRQSYRSTSI